MVEPPLRDAGETYQSASIFNHPHFMPLSDPAAEFRTILVRNSWQVAHSIPCSDKDAANRIGVDR